jgi:Flp pilus assembly protein TadD
MRLPVATKPFAMRIRPTRVIALALVCLCSAAWPCRPLAGQEQASSSSSPDRMHESEQWLEIQKHLPDPATASAKELEQQADILRARRFPADAMDFYRHAMDRGGNVPDLLNKLGLTELEMKNIELARSYFQRVVKLNRKDGQAWNNLGAVEFIDGQSGHAVSDYKKAIKLQKHEAVFHANLATAYFQTRNFGGARREMANAMKLDPHVFDRREGFGGVSAHVLSSQDRAQFSFEMAKLYAQNGLEGEMLHSLAMASEAGMDIQHEMRKDPVLAKFEMDPRVLVVVHNAQALRASRSAAVRPSGNSSVSGSQTSNPM